MSEWLVGLITSSRRIHKILIKRTYGWGETTINKSQSHPSLASEKAFSRSVPNCFSKLRKSCTERKRQNGVMQISWQLKEHRTQKKNINFKLLIHYARYPQNDLLQKLVKSRLLRVANKCSFKWRTISAINRIKYVYTQYREDAIHSLNHISFWSGNSWSL